MLSDGAEGCCEFWLASDPTTVYYSDSQGYMGTVQIAGNDEIVCHVVGTDTQAVTLDGVTQTLDNNNTCKITPTGNMTLVFNYVGGPDSESTIVITTAS